jgi:hypothetical protein
MPEEQTRLSRHRSFFTPWRRPVEQEKKRLSSCWTSSVHNTCGRQRDWHEGYFLGFCLPNAASASFLWFRAGVTSV